MLKYKYLNNKGLIDLESPRGGEKESSEMLVNI